MEIILAIAVIAGLVWGMVLLGRGGLVAGCLVVLLAGCCFGHPFFSLAIKPIPLTIDRALWIALFAAYIYGLRQGWCKHRGLGWQEYILGAFILVLLASTLSHNWRFNGNAPLAHLVFNFLMPVGVYWVARECKLSDRSLTAILYSFTGFGIYLALTAMAEVNTLWWAVFPKYIASTEYLEFYGRGRGPLLNPVSNGYYMAIGLFAAMLLWQRSQRTGRIVLSGVSFVISLGIFYTLTRSVWLGTGLGTLLIVMMYLPRRYRAPLLGSVLLVGTLVLATQWERIVAFKRDRALTAHQAAESVKLRPILAKVAWNMFLDRPLLGCGYGQYMVAQIDYLSDRTTDLPLSKARPYVQHNVFLALLVETGLLGAGLFVALLTFWAQAARRLWMTRSATEAARAQGLFFLAMMAYYLANGMFQDLSLMPNANMLLFFLAGMTEAAAAQFAPKPAAATHRLPIWGLKPAAKF